MRWSALFFLLLLVAGCSGLGDGRTIVRMADWSGAGDDSDFNNLVSQIYDEFEEAHPDLDLRIEGTPDMQTYVTKMLLSHVARTAPDVMRVDASSAAVFIDNGVLMDMSSYIEGDASFDLDDYFPNAVDITRRGEAIYGLPMGFTPMVLYYNKRLFDEAGVAYPDGTWTFVDFLSAARRLTTDDVYGFEFANWMAGWILFLWNNGGDVLSPDGTRASGYFDSPECIEAVQFIHDLVNVHRVSPTMSQTAALGVDLFANGRAAMKIVGHWAIIGFQSSKEISISEIGVAPIPSNLDSPVTVMYESGLAIFKDAKHPAAGGELIKHLLSYDVQTRYNATGIEVCALRSVAAEAADPVASRAKNRVVPAALEQAFVAIVPSARAPWGAKVERYNLVEPIGEKMMDRVLNQGVDVRTALRDAAREIDEELGKE